MLIICDFVFYRIWELQKIIMRANHKFENLLSGKKYVFFQKICGIVFIFSFSFFLFCESINNSLISHISLGIATLSVCLLGFTESTIQIFLSCCTSIRSFFIISIFFNGIIYLIINNYSSVLGIIIFSIMFFIISLISNTEISSTANTVVEIILALVTATKDYLINLFISFLNKTTDAALEQATIDTISESEIYKLKDYISDIEHSLSQQIDFYLYPLLIINGIALLLCFVHSHWVKKYNNGYQITWDKNLISEYIK
ncbi:MAG: hypothetical protein SPI07_09415 [Ruminococcus sp.]|nr:hypothetical protein [Ruminococcus sp.]